MPVQVLVKKKANIQGVREVVLAEVLSENKLQGTVRVAMEGLIPGQYKPIDVRMEDTLPISTLVPGQARIMGRALPTAPPKMYPGRTSLGAMLNKG